MVNLTPNQILWELPLADGLFYQRENWATNGVKLIRRAPGKANKVNSYFRAWA